MQLRTEKDNKALVALQNGWYLGTLAPWQSITIATESFAKNLQQTNF